MKLKLDESGHVVVKDGKPVYSKEDGTEIAFDASQSIGKIASLNAEARGHREAKEKAEALIKPFEGLDADKARSALETVSNLDAKKLVDAGEIERVRTEIKASFDPLVAENKSLKGELNDVRLSHEFSSSKFIQDSVAIPPDFLKANFSNNFSYENGQLIAKDTNGNTLYDPTGNGQNASFDDAIKTLVETHPQKDVLLKGTGSNGSGSEPNNGQSNGSKQVTRTQFDGMSHSDRTAFAKDGGKVVDA